MRKYDKFQLFLGVSSRSEFATAVENKKAIDCKLPTTLLPYANCAWVITLHVQVNLARIILNLSHSGNTCAIGNLNFNKTEKILPLTPLVSPYLFFRISLQEETNRMSANALAIVFAPCILRCPDSIDPLQSVQDIGKTTA